MYCSIRVVVAPVQASDPTILSRFINQILQPISQPFQISSASKFPHQPARSVESGSGSASFGAASASVPSATMTAVASACVSSSEPSSSSDQSQVTEYFGNCVFWTMRMSGMAHVRDHVFQRLHAIPQCLNLFDAILHARRHVARGICVIGPRASVRIAFDLDFVSRPTAAFIDENRVPAVLNVCVISIRARRVRIGFVIRERLGILDLDVTLFHLLELMVLGEFMEYVALFLVQRFLPGRIAGLVSTASIDKRLDIEFDA